MAQQTSTIAKNRKALHEYEVLERFVAGIALRGTEVKSCRAGRLNLKDGWVDLPSDSRAVLRQVHISEYSHGNIYNHETQRPRQLLLKKNELKRLYVAVTQKTLTVIPLKFFIKGQFIKVEIALARGRKSYDKRERAKQLDAEREIERSIANF